MHRMALLSCARCAQGRVWYYHPSCSWLCFNAQRGRLGVGAQFNQGLQCAMKCVKRILRSVVLCEFSIMLHNEVHVWKGYISAFIMKKV